MPNSINIYKEIFLHVIPVCVIIPCINPLSDNPLKLSNAHKQLVAKSFSIHEACCLTFNYLIIRPFNLLNVILLIVIKALKNELWI